jgi:HSP20 family protein
MADESIQRKGPDMPGPLDRVDQMWRWLLGGPRRSEGIWHPVVDVYEKTDGILVQVELPGMAGQKVDVSLQEDHLVIEGLRAQPEEPGGGEAYYLERPVGRFHRIIHLPCSVDEAGTEAHYDDGILTVTMPKAERAKARRIPIA